jgi:hypothetical protein
VDLDDVTLANGSDVPPIARPNGIIAKPARDCNGRYCKAGERLQRPVDDEIIQHPRHCRENNERRHRIGRSVKSA